MTDEAKKVETPEAELSGSMALVTRKAAQLDEMEWPDERIGAVYRTCAPKDTTRAQFAIFLATCQKYNLNPLTREIWLANMGGKIMVVTGRDAFIKVMNREPDFDGIISGVVFSKDEFAVERQGDKVVVRHKVTGFDRGVRAGGYCIVKRKGKPDIIAMRAWGDFKHLHGKDSWKNYPDDMLETRCIVSAARRAYNLAGLEEETVATDLAERGTGPIDSAATGAAEAGTKDTAAALRERMTKLASQSPTGPTAGAGLDPDASAGQPEALADAAPESDFEVVQDTVETEAAMDRKIRLEELVQLYTDDRIGYNAAMESLMDGDRDLFRDVTERVLEKRGS